MELFIFFYSMLQFVGLSATLVLAAYYSAVYEYTENFVFKRWHILFSLIFPFPVLFIGIVVMLVYVLNCIGWAISKTGIVNWFKKDLF